MTEGKNKRETTVARIPHPLAKRLKIHAIEKDCRMQELVARYVEEGLARDLDRDAKAA